MIEYGVLALIGLIAFRVVKDVILDDEDDEDEDDDDEDEDDD